MNSSNTEPHVVNDEGTGGEGHSNRRFALHYVEMVIVMFAGMALLYLPIEAGLGAIGTSTSELQRDAPAAALFAMAMSMTVPMVAWMGFRGHGSRLSMEMAASMLLPTVAVVGLLEGAIVEDYDTLLLIEHVVMLPSMLVAMLLRRNEYSGHAHGRRARQQVACV